MNYDSVPLRDFKELNDWETVIFVYQSALKQVETKIDILNGEFQHRHKYNPIEHVKSRIKTPESIVKKLKRHGYESSIENMVRYVNDIAGIRISCSFTSDIYLIADMISKQNDLTILARRDYMKNPKKSGYRSYHMIVYYEVQTLKGCKRIKVEIQIRTLAMNFWSTIEHSLQYKYKGSMPEHIRKKLMNASDAILLLDNEMSAVRSEIMDAQNSFQIQANLVSDILNNIQNLYHLANKREIVRIQDEFYHIYGTNDLEQLRRFHKQLDIISEGYRAQSNEHHYEENL